MKKPTIRLRIEGSGPDTRKGWRVVDAETGKPIEGVVAVSVEASVASGRAAHATIELVAFDFSAEVEATARRFGLPPAPRPT